MTAAVVISADDFQALLRRIEALHARLDALAPPQREYTVKEYADLFGVHVSTVNRWINQGELRTHGAGKRRRILA
jgi:excisionase family DNA binding protein